MLIDSDWCRLMLIDTDWYWQILIVVCPHLRSYQGSVYQRTKYVEVYMKWSRPFITLSIKKINDADWNVVLYADWSNWSWLVCWLISWTMLTDDDWCILMYWVICWLRLTDANWCWLVRSDAAWGWLMLIDADLCWLMQIDAHWGWLSLIDNGWCWLVIIDTDWCRVAKMSQILQIYLCKQNEELG